MLYWICPECGKEYLPAGTDCPVCVLANVALWARALEILSEEALPAQPDVAEAPVPENSAQWARALEVLSEEALTASMPPVPRGAELIPEAPGVRGGPLPFRAPSMVLIPPLLAQPSPSSPIARRPGLPKWVVSTLVAGVVALAIASSIQKLVSSPDTSAHTFRAPIPPVPTQPPAMAPDPEYPYAQFVQVTGFKLVDLNDRIQAQYQVVNCSPMPLTDMGLRIAVRSARAGAGSAPLFTLAARVPKLESFESKEIRTDLDTRLRLSSERSDLLTEVRISSQQ